MISIYNPGKYLLVEGDYDDGDYAYSMEDVSNLSEEELKSLVNLLRDAVEDESVMDNNYELIMSYLPYGPNGSEIHSIGSISVLEVSSVNKL